MPSKPIPPAPRVCPVCGVSFVPRHGNSRMCSGECRDARANRWSSDGRKRECIQCGGMFEPVERLQRLCGEECRRARQAAGRLRNQRIYRAAAKAEKPPMYCVACGHEFIRAPRSNAKRCDECRIAARSKTKDEFSVAKRAEYVEARGARVCIDCRAEFTTDPRGRSDRCAPCRAEHRKHKRAGYDRDYHERSKAERTPKRAPVSYKPAPTTAPQGGRPPRQFTEDGGYWSFDEALKREAAKLKHENKPRYKDGREEAVAS